MLDSLMPLELPYITKEQAGIGGQLRATPEHFVVEELPLYAPSGEGQHLYVNLTKVGVTTKEVQLQLARLFSIRPTEVGFAGMKDKQARTTQTFSLSVGHKAPNFAEEAAQRIRDELDVEVNWTRFHTNKLRSGHLLGNRFTITVTELACEFEEALARARRIAEVLADARRSQLFRSAALWFIGGQHAAGAGDTAGRPWSARPLVAQILGLGLSKLSMQPLSV